MKNERLLTLVYSYYDNPGMLRRQVEEWEKYPQKIQQMISIIITDDCSSKSPLTSFKFPVAINGLLFRITRKVPWNWLACRNIGAHYAKTKWILLTDMDHMLSVESSNKLLSKLSNLEERFVYLFTRVDAPDNIPYKPHNDSFLMTKKLFWEIGGYDEELAGNYGTSGRFRQRAFEIAQGNIRLRIPLTRFPREVIADASTMEFIRKGLGRDSEAIKHIEAKKAAEGRSTQIVTLSFPYERIKG